MSEANALVKQDAKDTETKVASDKNSLATDEVVASAGGAASGVVLLARGAGDTAPGRRSRMPHVEEAK